MLSLNALGTRITTDSIVDIKEQLQEADANTWVIFDCDDTLIRNKDQILRRKNELFLMTNAAALIALKGISPKKFKEMVKTVLQTAELTLVHDDLPKIVKNLQEKGVRVLVLTAMVNERFAAAQALDIRIKKLKSFGFDFSKGWETVSRKPFKKPSKESPRYRHGILCSEKRRKGEALKSFVKLSSKKPSKIIFVDDIEKNLEDVEKAAKELGIKFTGILYTAASRPLPNELPFSEEIGKFQLEYICDTGKWLSDEKASRKILERSSNITDASDNKNR
jgi:hypothetical protein